MATITWLHLSDLHACRPRTGWDAARVQETLIEDLARLKEQHGLAPDLLFFTGDAAFGEIGSKPEETVAGQLQVFAAFLDEVRKAIDPAFPWENVFLVPGNHDVNWSLVDEAHTAWLDQPERTLDDVIGLIQGAKVTWRNVMERLGSYHSFLERHPDLHHLVTDPDRLVYAMRRRIAELTVGIAGFNSAWSCCRDGENGKLWMAGKWQQGTLRAGLKDCDFSIALMHHPPDWLSEREKPAFGRRLRQDFQFLLHGHEHQEWVEPSVDGYTVVAAGACYERSEKENGYNVVRLDVEEGRGEVWLRRFDSSGGGWVPRPVHGKTDDRGVWPIAPPWLAKLRRPPAARPAGGPKRKAVSRQASAAHRAAALDASSELTRYLRRLRAAHCDLPVAGFETRVRIPIHIDDVFIPLRARVYRRALEKERKELGALQDLLAQEPEERPIPFHEALILARRHGLPGAVVLGDPGSGKTTLLKHFVLAATSPESGAAGLGLPAGTVPVFISLRRLTRAAAGLEPAIARALAEADPALDAPRFARELIARDGLLLLVDGLDELADPGERAKVSRWLEKAVQQLPDSTFVVTSRYAGYKGDARLDGRFLELHVQDVEENEARRFVSKWYQAVESQVDLGRDPEAAEAVARAAADDLGERIFGAEDPRVSSLRSLARNPLMLQILCLVHRDRKTLPEKRVALYRECLLVLLDLWRRAKEMPVEIEAEKALKLLQPLAWWLHTQQRKEARIEEILPHLAGPLRELRESPEAGAALLAAIRDQSGALVYLGGKAYGFLHLSFQEYLAARHVQERIQAKPKLLGELASHFGEPWWREVILLAVGLDGTPLFGPLMVELLRRQVLHRDAALADDCLRDALAAPPGPVLQALAGGIESREERYAALRLLKALPDWQGEDLGEGRTGRDVVAALAGNAAEGQGLVEAVQRLAEELLGAGAGPAVVTPGRLSAGQEQVHSVDGSVLVYVPGGDFTLGAEDLSTDEKPVHRVRLSPFWIGKYPVTNEQYGRFLAVTLGHPPPEFWDDRSFNQPAQPVVGVSWHDARAYCGWAGLALPTEAQWEAAARGTDQRRYPWGDAKPTAAHANFRSREGRTTPVGAYPAGAGPYGALDQAGNVWEWCADGWDRVAYRARDGELDPFVPTQGEAADVALRGGSWNNSAELLAAAFRGWLRARNRSQRIGFRCVLVPFSEHG